MGYVRACKDEAVTAVLGDLLADYLPRTASEAADLHRARALAETSDNPWLRTHPLHVTSSAVILHPPTRQVLLRWHNRQQSWLHVGGHGDPGENVPLDVAAREAVEETGLDDLEPWPDASLVHLAIVSVPASVREPAHEHADLRFVLATAAPELARPEDEVAALRWLPIEQARTVTASASLRETLDRIRPLLPHAS